MGLNVNIAEKQTGDQLSAAEFELLKDFVNSPEGAAGDFNPAAIDLTQSRPFNEYTQSGSGVWTVSQFTTGNQRLLPFNSIGENIKLDLTFNAGLIFGITPDENRLFSLPSGFYNIILFAMNGKCGVNIPAAGPIDNAGPKINSVTISADNSYIDIVTDKPLYSFNTLNPAELSDFSIVFAANGGTATAWTPSSIKKNDNTSEGSAGALVGGETTIRIFGAVSGIPEGSETITISPANANVLSDQNGFAMGESESETDNLNIVAYDISANAFVYYDATQVTEADGVEVTTLQDQTANNRDAIVASPVTQGPAVDVRTIGGQSVKTLTMTDRRCLNMQFSPELFANDNFEIWVAAEYADGQGFNNSLFGSYDAANVSNKIRFLIGTNGANNFSIGNVTDGGAFTVFGNTLADGPAAHLVYRFIVDYDNNELKMYEDGELIDTVDITALNPSNWALTIPMLLGGVNDGTATVQYNGIASAPRYITRFAIITDILNEGEAASVLTQFTI